MPPSIAPLITPLNKPRYMASQGRAQLFVQYNHTQLLWVQADDYPMSGDITNLQGDELEQRRRNWLRRHDQDTKGIMGLLPLVAELPVRFTMTLDKVREIYKFAKGNVVGWTLDPVDEVRLRDSTESEIVLLKMPLVIYVRRQGEGMPQHLSLEPEVYAVTPRGAQWPIDPSKENWVKRIGFPLVPDFASTVHAITGDQLKTAVGDLGSVDARVNTEDALMGYITLSRVEEGDGMLIAQPCSPALFTQGPLEGAELLMSFLRGEVPEGDLKARWDALEERAKMKRTDLDKQHWDCGVCAAGRNATINMCMHRGTRSPSTSENGF